MVNMSRRPPNLERALSLLRLCLRLDKDYVPANFQAGVIYHSLGHLVRVRHHAMRSTSSTSRTVRVQHTGRRRQTRRQPRLSVVDERLLRCDSRLRYCRTRPVATTSLRSSSVKRAQRHQRHYEFVR